MTTSVALWSRIFSRYETALVERPVPTKMATGAILWGACQQTPQKRVTAAIGLRRWRHGSAGGLESRQATRQGPAKPSHNFRLSYPRADCARSLRVSRAIRVPLRIFSGVNTRGQAHNGTVRESKLTDPPWRSLCCRYTGATSRIAFTISQWRRWKDSQSTKVSRVFMTVSGQR